jgi:hypothetical protein
VRERVEYRILRGGVYDLMHKADSPSKPPLNPRTCFFTVVHRRCRSAGYETGYFLSSAESATNPRVPHPPGFPVKLGGVNELHAAFLIESRTCDHGRGRAVGNPGSFALFAKGGISRISIPTVAYPNPLQRAQRMGPTLSFVAC